MWLREPQPTKREPLRCTESIEAVLEALEDTERILSKPPILSLQQLETRNFLTLASTLTSTLTSTLNPYSQPLTRNLKSQLATCNSKPQPQPLIKLLIAILDFDLFLL